MDNSASKNLAEDLGNLFKSINKLTGGQNVHKLHHSKDASVRSADIQQPLATQSL
jgi:hypothetical protein